MTNCLYCGKKLKEGETCSCQSVQETQGSPNFQGAQSAQSIQNMQGIAGNPNAVPYAYPVEFPRQENGDAKKYLCSFI